MSFKFTSSIGASWSTRVCAATCSVTTPVAGTICSTESDWPSITYRLPSWPRVMPSGLAQPSWKATGVAASSAAASASTVIVPSAANSNTLPLHDSVKNALPAASKTMSFSLVNHALPVPVTAPIWAAVTDTSQLPLLGSIFRIRPAPASLSRMYKASAWIACTTLPFWS